MDFNRFTRVSLDLNLVDIVTRVFTGFHGSDGFYRVILLIIFYRVLPSFPRSEMVINNNNNNNKTKDTHTQKKSGSAGGGASDRRSLPAGSRRRRRRRRCSFSFSLRHWFFTEFS